MYIAEAANVLAPAYAALVQKGFSIRTSGPYMIAERGSDRFVAEDPLRLLGLVALTECRGSDWRVTGEEVEEFTAKFG